LEFPGKKRKTRRGLFPERMDGLNPWQGLEQRIRLFSPKQRRQGPAPLPTNVQQSEATLHHPN
jgi:hypothetical protein